MGSTGVGVGACNWPSVICETGRREVVVDWELLTVTVSVSGIVSVVVVTPVSCEVELVTVVREPAELTVTVSVSGIVSVVVVTPFV